MILECPRCGFAQPKDRYCANCGVDMERFQKAPQPKIQKLLTSPIFQLSLIFLAVSAIILFIYSNQKKNLSPADSNLVTQDSQTQNSNQTEGGKKTKITNNLTVKNKDVSNKKININAETIVDPDSAAALEKLKNLKSNDNSNESGLKSAHDAGLFESGAPINLQIRFAEIPINSISSIKETGNSIGSTNNAIAYSFQPEKGIKGFFNSTPDLHLFQSYTKTNQVGEDEISLNIEYKAAAPTNEELGAEAPSPGSQGLTLSIRPELGKDSVNMSIEGSLRVINPADGSEITQIFEASSLTLKPGQILILNEFIPQLPFTNDSQSESSPLSVLFNQDFKANNSDLVLFLNLKK